ncbi:MAG: peptidase M28, partial [Mycoplasmataceae bacterium]|nr:peptidase M28 [Mycoplasmataceae bacterium]
MSKDIEIVLKELSNLPSTSGDEELVVDYLKSELKGYGLEVERDNLGSIAFIKRGKGNGPSMMFAAHMDSPGFMVSGIDKQGTIRLTQIGGWWGHVLLAQLVNIHSKKGIVTGIVGSRPPHIVSVEERKKVVELKDMFVDIGSQSKEETIKKFGVNIGDRVTPKSNAFNLNGTHYIAGKGLDDKASLAAWLFAMKQLAKLDTH